MYKMLDVLAEKPRKKGDIAREGYIFYIGTFD